MPTAWRIAKTRFVSTAFSGEGARLYGGRWNSLGNRVVYTSSTRALAILEVLVHVDNAALLSSFSLCAIHFDDAVVARFDISLLPANWRDYPAPSSLQGIGDDWISSRTSAVLEVPSAVAGTESNFLLNPDHPDFATFTVDLFQPYPLDSRLV